MSHIAPWSGKPPIRSGPHVASRLPQHLYSALNEPSQNAPLKETTMGFASLLAVLASTFILDAVAHTDRLGGKTARAAARPACGSPGVQWAKRRPGRDAQTRSPLHADGLGAGAVTPKLAALSGGQRPQR